MPNYDTLPNQANYPNWILASVGVLVAYQIAMYGWVMRIVLHPAVALWPWLMNKPGYRLYDNIYVGYGPDYMWLNGALERLLPNPELRVRLEMIALVTISTLIIFWLTTRWWGASFGLLAVALYVFWAPVIMEYLMYFDVVVGFGGLAALAVWHRSIPKSAWWRPFVAGIFVGLTMLTKQQGITLIAVFAIWRVLSRSWRTSPLDLVRFILGVLIPVCITGIILSSQGLLGTTLFMLTFFIGHYVEVFSSSISRSSELVLLVMWLGLIPFFVFYVLQRRDQWGSEGVLLIGLLPNLLILAYPRYGRFHLSAATPVVALMGAGAAYYAFQAFRKNGNRFWRYLRTCVVGAAALSLIIALPLPTYYRMKLGPQVDKFEALKPLGQWLTQYAGAAPGIRAWILPDIDPTGNFYVVSDFLPPTFWTETYDIIFDRPEVGQRLIASLKTDPPRYAVLINNWSNQAPEMLLEYLHAHYTPIGTMYLGYNINSPVIFYKLAETISL